MGNTLISPRRIAQECAYLLFKRIGQPHHKMMDGTHVKTDDCGGFYSPEGEAGQAHTFLRVLTVPDQDITKPLQYFSDTHLAPLVAEFVDGLPASAEWHHGAAAVIDRAFTPQELRLLIELRAAPKQTS